MYLAHYDLKEKPFQISPDPRFLWLGETHKEALSKLNYGLYDNRGFLLLAGDIGTGKTTLINGLLDNLDENTQVATIPDPGLEKLDFYNFLTHEFDIHKRFQSKGDFLVHFIHFLHKTHADGKKVLIIIDEAQRLDHEMLEELRQLSNIEKRNTKLLNIFLVGQHELIDALNETRNSALLQRITTKYLIGPLKKTEVEDYIQFRLKVAGTEKRIFSAGAIRHIISFSNCYPRLINIVCDHALLTAYVKGKKKIDAGIVKECVKDLEIKVEKPKDTHAKVGIFSGVINTLTHPFEKPYWNIPLYTLLTALIIFVGLWYVHLAEINIPGPNSIIDKLLVRKEPLPTEKTRPKKVISEPPEKKPLVTSETDSSAVSTRDSTIHEESEKSVSDASHPQPAPFDEKKYTIRFALDSNEFSADAYARLNQIVDILSQYPDLKISITGYTDSRGDYAYNKRLSKFRANVVESYLVGHGIDVHQITVLGMGPDNPIADNDTIEGRKLNRRVEIQLKK